MSERSGLARRLGLRLLLGVVLLALLLVGGTFVRVWQVARVDNRHRADTLVVLGTTQANGDPNPIFQSRLDHALTLFNQGVAGHIVTVGGGMPGDNYTEAEAGANYLNHAGVPRTALVEVPHGRDTLGSLRGAAKVMRSHGWHSAVLVTDPWHELRCRTMARDLGITAWISPTRSGPTVDSRTTELRYVSRETAALLFYQLTKGSVRALESADGS